MVKAHTVVLLFNVSQKCWEEIEKEKRKKKKGERKWKEKEKEKEKKKEKNKQTGSVALENTCATNCAQETGRHFSSSER